MTTPRIKPAYTKFDPAHLFDGLFVPTNGKKRGRLLVAPRSFGNLEIGFQGFEQLGADDQSILLALTAQLGIDGLIIDSNPQGPVSRQLRLGLDFNDDDGAPLASKRTSLRSLLIDAGHNPDTSTEKAKASLNRLRATQIREINSISGWDRVCNLISVSYNHKSGEIYVAANPRLTSAVFKGHHIKISLFERNTLVSEVAKILHCWLCSNIRLGHKLGCGNGAHVDTLAPHVWGQADWVSASRKVRSTRRSQLRDALDEIYDCTKSLHGGYGWSIDQTGSGIVLVSRPEELPVAEGRLDMSPSEFHEVMTNHAEPEEADDWVTH